MLGIVFEKQNIAFMVSLAFAIAASANFPVLFMSVLWKDCTTRGAVIGGFLGLVSSVVLTVVSPSVWEATLGNPKGSALFPYASPALFSMTIGFVGIWLFSILDSSARAAHGPRRLPGAAGALGDRHRRLGGIRALSAGIAKCDRSPSIPSPPSASRSIRPYRFSRYPVLSWRFGSSRRNRCSSCRTLPCRSTRWWRSLHEDGARIERIARLVCATQLEPLRAPVVAARACGTAVATAA